MSSGYIYLLQPLRSITDNKQIYKIGKTKRDNFKRFNEYPVGSILLLQSSCKNCDLMERRLLKIFDEKFIKQKDYGIEYFRGDLIKMKKVINSEIMNEEVVIDDNINDISTNNTFIELSLVNENEVDEMYELTKVEPCGIINKRDTNKYFCEKCAFNTNNKNNFDKHLLTEKHKNLNNELQKGNNNSLQCSCGKVFNFRQGLHKHNKICKFKNVTSLEKSYNEAKSDKILSIPFVINLINQNEEIKDLLMLQSKQLIDQVNEKSKQLIDQANQQLKTKDELINKLIERQHLQVILGSSHSPSLQEPI